MKHSGRLHPVGLSAHLTYSVKARPPTKLATDNKGARDLAYNPEHHDRSKHILRRHFYVRDVVENLELVIPYVPSKENLADFFTKPLPAKTFFTMHNIIMNIKNDTA